jgi:hypothetical protein
VSDGNDRPEREQATQRAVFDVRHGRFQGGIGVSARRIRRFIGCRMMPGDQAFVKPEQMASSV